jgi:hypothetical protein
MQMCCHAYRCFSVVRVERHMRNFRHVHFRVSCFFECHFANRDVAVVVDTTLNDMIGLLDQHFMYCVMCFIINLHIIWGVSGGARGGTPR